MSTISFCTECSVIERHDAIEYERRGSHPPDEGEPCIYCDGTVRILDEEIAAQILRLSLDYRATLVAISKVISPSQVDDNETFEHLPERVEALRDDVDRRDRVIMNQPGLLALIEASERPVTGPLHVARDELAELRAKASRCDRYESAPGLMTYDQVEANAPDSWDCEGPSQVELVSFVAREQHARSVAEGILIGWEQLEAELAAKPGLMGDSDLAVLFTDRAGTSFRNHRVLFHMAAREQHARDMVECERRVAAAIAAERKRAEEASEAMGAECDRQRAMEFAGLRSDRETLRAVAHALGICHEADGHACQPGPVDALLARVKELQHKADEYDAMCLGEKKC